MRGSPERGPFLYGAAFLLHLALLWSLPFIPSQDGPSHLYNALIIRDLLHGGRAYGAFFNLHLSLTPNLGAVVPLYGLTAVLSPLAAEKAFLTVVMALLVGVMPRLARMVGGQPYPGSFVVFSLLFSALVLQGFYSFVLGLALCLWAMWLHWRMRDRSLWQQWVVSTCSALCLLFCHLLPFACYLLAVAVATLLPTPSGRPLAGRVRTTALYLVVPGLILAAYAWSLATATPSVPYAPFPATPSLLSGLDWPLNVVALVYLATLGQPALALVQVATGWSTGVVLAWLFLRPGTRLSSRWPDPGSNVREDAVAARRWLVVVSALMVVGMLVVPDAVGELAFIKLRFPSMVCLLMVPLACCVTPLPALRRAVLAVSLIGAAVNGWYVERYARQIQTFVTAGPQIDVRGRFVAGYLGIQPEGLSNVLLHATSYYCALRECVDLGNYQAFLGHFFVAFKSHPALALSRYLETHGTTIRWEDYPDVASLRGWGFRPEERARVGRVYDLVGEAGPLTVWRRSGCARAATARTAVQ